MPKKAQTWRLSRQIAVGLIELFNPRLHRWEDHFATVGAEIIGISQVGRATVALLDLNNEERLMVRKELRAEGLI
jgi:hypothetical protein